MTGIKVTEQGVVPLADDLLVISEGNSARMPASALDRQFAGARSYASVDALVASAHGARGANSAWRARGHDYIEAAPGAADAHLETQSGVPFYINSGRYDLSAEAWGVRLTGDPADGSRNRIALQRAIDYLDGEGQGGRIRLGSDGDCVVDQPPMLKDNIQIDLGGGQLRNTRGADGAAFLSHQAVQIGKMHPRHMDILDWKPLSAVGFGDDVVTLQTAGHGSGFVAGDMILIAEAAATLGGTLKTLPAWAQWCRVRSVVEGAIALERPVEKALDAGGGSLGANAEGAWIANVAYRTRNAKPWASTDLNTWLDGAPWMAYRPSLVNGRLSTQFGGAIQGVGMYEGLWQDLRVYPGEAADGRGFGGIYSNAFAHSRLKGIVSSAYERFIEVKCLSQHSVIEDFEVYAMAHPHSDAEVQNEPIAVGEGSRDVLFRHGLVNLGARKSGDATSDLNLINFTPAQNCTFDGLKVVSATEWARIAFADAASDGCSVINCDFDVEARVLVEAEGSNFSVMGNTFRRFTNASERFVARVHGEMVGGRIANNHFVHEGPVKILAATNTGAVGTWIYGNRGVTLFDDISNGTRAIFERNRGATWDMLLFAGARRTELEVSVDSTSEVAIGAPVICPAGTLRSGDFIEWKVKFRANTANGARVFSWRAAADNDQDGVALDPDDDTNIAGTLTFPASCNDGSFTVSAQVSGSSVILNSAQAHDLTNGTDIAGDNTSNTSVNFGTRPVRFELSGYKQHADDTLIVQSIRRTIERPGYV